MDFKEAPKGYKFEVKVNELKGFCRKGHKVGDIMYVNPLEPGDLCGSAFHALFPMLIAMNMGAKLPWNPEGNTIYTACPDYKNQMVMEVTRLPQNSEKNE